MDLLQDQRAFIHLSLLIMTRSLVPDLLASATYLSIFKTKGVLPQRVTTTKPAVADFPGSPGALVDKRGAQVCVRPLQVAICQ
jgi:hypothetical protein